MEKLNKIREDNQEQKTPQAETGVHEQEASSLIKNSQSFLTSKFFLALILLILVTGALIGYKTYRLITLSQQQQQTKVVMQQQLVRRSKISGVIVRATTAKAIDVKTGKVIQAARIFSINDKTIYLTLDLNSAKIGTNIDYIRYLNGRYVDHGNVKTTTDGANNISFSWTNSKPLGSITDGKWKIATYTNGILEKRVTYLVKKNQITQIYPDNPVYSSDHDYHLGNSLAFLPLQ